MFTGIEMAFGSWFKNLISGAKNVIGKALPVLRKGAEIVSKVAPVIGGAIGGAAGNVINKIGNYAGKFAGNKSLGTAIGPYNAVGTNGAGIRQNTNSYHAQALNNNVGQQPISGPFTNPGRFDIPLLK